MWLYWVTGEGGFGSAVILRSPPPPESWASLLSRGVALVPASTERFSASKPARRRCCWSITHRASRRLRGRSPRTPTRGRPSTLRSPSPLFPLPPPPPPRHPAPTHPTLQT